MSTFWTPEGERPIPRREPPASSASDARAAPDDATGTVPGVAPGAEADEQAAVAAEMERLRRALAQTPVEVILADHVLGLLQVAGLHLSEQPPNLDQARLAIDAVAALVDGLAGRLGAQETGLRDSLHQLRMAFAEISSARPRRDGT